MRLRALSVSAIAFVTAFVMVVPAFAGSDHGRGHHKHHDKKHHKHHDKHDPDGDGELVTGPVDISGVIGGVTDDDADDTTALRYVGDPAPDDFGHSYQWADPYIETSPADGPVTFTGTLDVRERVPNTVGTIGLVELGDLEDGGDARDTGALIYLWTQDDGAMRIGPSDGRAGGEIVQRFITIPAADVPEVLDITFVVDGTADSSTCAVLPPDPDPVAGCMTLTIGDAAPLGDSYGTIKAAVGEEFADGATPGWEMFLGDELGDDANIAYEFTIDPATTLVEGPDSKDDCKHGGWRDYGYENQGQCIKDVVGKGKGGHGDRGKREGKGGHGWHDGRDDHHKSKHRHGGRRGHDDHRAGRGHDRDDRWRGDGRRSDWSSHAARWDAHLWKLLYHYAS